MRSLFGTRPSWWGPRTANTDGAGVPAGADRPSEQPIGRADVDAAYNKGRWDEARRRQGHPFFSFLVLLVVAAAGMMVYLAAQGGSFANGGAAVDNRISQASQTVQAPFKRATAKAGDALERAGQNLKQDAGDQPTNQ
jgi:hypothetical protein